MFGKSAKPRPIPLLEASIKAELAQAAAAKVGERALAYNAGKRRFSLLPASWSRVLVDVFEAGAKKYSPNNWKKSLGTEEHDSFRQARFDSMERHVDEAKEGRIIDRETGMPIMALIAWNALACFWYDVNDPRINFPECCEPGEVHYCDLP